MFIPIKLKALHVKLAFARDCFVDCTGHSDGVAVLWRNLHFVNISSYNNNFISVEVIEDNLANWRLSSFFGYPERSRQKASWDLLRLIFASSTLPWCCIGDCNDLLSADEKKRESGPSRMMF